MPPIPKGKGLRLHFYKMIMRQGINKRFILNPCFEKIFVKYAEVFRKMTGWGGDLSKWWQKKNLN